MECYIAAVPRWRESIIYFPKIISGCVTTSTHYVGFRKLLPDIGDKYPIKIASMA
jgi:hypothetical protein